MLASVSVCVLITLNFRAPTSQKDAVTDPIRSDPIRGLLGRRGKGNRKSRPGVQTTRRKAKRICLGSEITNTHFSGKKRQKNSNIYNDIILELDRIVQG